MMRHFLGSVLVCFGLTCGLKVWAQVFPAEVDLSSLLISNGGDGSTGMVLKGGVNVEFAGKELSVAGDINADGLSDVLIGADSSSESGFVQSGRVYVVFGDNSPPAEFSLSSLTIANGGNGADGFVIDGFQIFGDLGEDVGYAGDINHDGIDDFIVGADGTELENPERRGQAYVIYGKNTPFDADFDLQGLFTVNGGTGAEGFVLNAGSDADDLGAAVTDIGDVNNDGFNDLLIGAPESNPDVDNSLFSTGAAYLVYGSASPFPAEFETVWLTEEGGGDGSLGTYFVGAGIGNKDRTGSAASYIGDINGDGIDDIAIAAPRAGEFQPRGGVFIVYGREQGFSANFELADLLEVNGGDGSEGFFIRGYQAVEYTGASLCSAGDFNGDGINDILISGLKINIIPGPLPSETYTNRAYLIYGSDNGFPAQIEIGDLFEVNGGNGSVGVALTAEEESGGDYVSVCFAGDINNDGLDDLIFGSPSESYQGLSGAGRSYVVYGTTAPLPAEYDLTQLLIANGGDGSKGFVLGGINTLERSGSEVESAGDFNGDGVSDLMVSAINADNDGLLNSGSVYIVFGRSADDDNDGIDNHQDNCLLVSNADQVDTDNDGFGNRCDADFNNDLIVNFLDLVLFSEAFLTSAQLYDLNQDGAVNFLDLAIFSDSFLNPPGPSGLVGVSD